MKAKVLRHKSKAGFHGIVRDRVLSITEDGVVPQLLAADSTMERLADIIDSYHEPWVKSLDEFELVYVELNWGHNAVPEFKMSDLLLENMSSTATEAKIGYSSPSLNDMERESPQTLGRMVNEFYKNKSCIMEGKTVDAQKPIMAKVVKEIVNNNQALADLVKNIAHNTGIVRGQISQILGPPEPVNTPDLKEMPIPCSGDIYLKQLQGAVEYQQYLRHLLEHDFTLQVMNIDRLRELVGSTEEEQAI